MTASKSTGHSSDNEDSVIDTLQAQIEELTRQVQALRSDRSRQPSKNSSGFRNRSRSRTKTQATDLCFYHTRFGDKARKCEKPCSASENSEARRF